MIINESSILIHSIIYFLVFRKYITILYIYIALISVFIFKFKRIVKSYLHSLYIFKESHIYKTSAQRKPLFKI